MSTTGMPFRSISFAIVAPLRVPVPHVAVSTTPFTPEAKISSAIPTPSSCILAGMAPVPVSVDLGGAGVESLCSAVRFDFRACNVKQWANKPERRELRSHGFAFTQLSDFACERTGRRVQHSRKPANPEPRIKCIKIVST